jgi:parvulin-like peptidyl-prolyl isomerase
MVQFRAVSAALVLSLGLVLIEAPVAMAQPASGDQASSSVGASTPKQIAKAQRKAERKARREKKNAELKALEKNGYRESGNQDNYPQNLMDAERKAAASKSATPAPASGQ